MKVIIVDGCVALQGGLMKSTGEPAPLGATSDSRPELNKEGRRHD
ncbi:hypothetical protein D3OALGA1CA_5908 [Olavius algarvensis associated proteobacterium Delta 3]|nr:hypothetical protein D3OALGA1CA_5908 [Olavius algarvensis associated proteobacterium Delta 3]